jgi:hypothetical protein
MATKTKKSPGNNKPKAKVAWTRAEKSCFSQKDVNVIGPALADLAASGIDLNIDNVIDAAKDKNSPLHQYLWGVPTKKAVDEWRRRKAGDMLRSVYVKFVFVDASNKQHTEKARAFHRVEKERQVSIASEDGGTEFATVKGGVYVPLTEVVDTPEFVAQVVKRFEDDMHRAAKNYKYYAKRLPGFKQQVPGVLARLVNLFNGAAGDF